MCLRLVASSSTYTLVSREYEVNASALRLPQQIRLRTRDAASFVTILRIEGLTACIQRIYLLLAFALVVVVLLYTT